MALIFSRDNNDDLLAQHAKGDEARIVAYVVLVAFVAFVAFVAKVFKRYRVATFDYLPGIPKIKPMFPQVCRTHGRIKRIMHTHSMCIFVCIVNP